MFASLGAGNVPGGNMPRIQSCLVVRGGELPNGKRAFGAPKFAACAASLGRVEQRLPSACLKRTDSDPDEASWPRLHMRPCVAGSDLCTMQMLDCRAVVHEGVVPVRIERKVRASRNDCRIKLGVRSGLRGSMVPCSHFCRVFQPLYQSSRLLV